jgi:hypothetical protein
MTEDEARKLWCPFARDAIEAQGTYNRLDDGEAPNSCWCLASGCMAWRWDSLGQGHCGLAGALHA